MNGAASPRIRKTMVFVLLALFLGQFGSGVYDLVFSNFLRDAQHLDVEMRGLIEFPRELPGILSLFVVSLLFMFNEVRMAGVACLLMFGGMYALAFCGAGTSLWALSAWILTLLPFVLAGTISVVNLKFLSVLWTDPIGPKMIAGALIMMILGIFWMWRIIKIRV